MFDRAGLFAALIFALLVAPSAHILAEDYFPLQPGGSWTYQTGESGTLEITHEGRRHVGGSPVVAFRELTTGDEYIDINSFWGKDYWGNLYLYGNETHSLTYGDYITAFEEPLCMLKLPLTPEASWSLDSYFYQDHTTEYPALFLVRGAATVIGEEEIVVPAGRFQAMGVHYEINYHSTEAGDSDGAERPAKAQQKGVWTTIFEAWYADGIGMVQRYRVGGFPVYSLVSWDIETATEGASWGKLKALFR